MVTGTYTEDVTAQLKTSARLRIERLTRLVELNDEQRLMLLQTSHPDLSENLKAQDIALAELAQLEKSEEALYEAAVPSGGGGDSTLDPEYKALAEKAADVALRLRSLVHTNTELVENAMQYVTFSLSILSTLSDDQQPYDPTSAPKGNNLALLLDKKV